MTERVLITGAQGFLGRHVISYWFRAYPDTEILGLGRSPRADDTFTHLVSWGPVRLLAPIPSGIRLDPRDPRYRYAPVDLVRRGDVQALLKNFRPQSIVHLAAALRDEPPERLFRTNVEGTIALLEAVAAAGIELPRIVFGSSGAVYGNSDRDVLPLQEGAPRWPIDLYAVSKLAAEEAARVLAQRYQIPLVIARIFNPVGPGEDERHLCGRLAAQVAAIGAGVLSPTIRVGPLDSTRDFVDVRDVARALVQLAHTQRPLGIYNVASGVETPTGSILQILIWLAELGGRVQVERQPGRPADIPRHVADIARLNGLGFRAEYALEASLGDLLDYYQTEVRATADSKDQGSRGAQCHGPSGSGVQFGGEKGPRSTFD